MGRSGVPPRSPWVKLGLLVPLRQRSGTSELPGRHQSALRIALFTEVARAPTA